MKYLRALLLFVILGAVCANAEMRVWTAVNGKTVEAEFVKITGDKVVFTRANGKTIKVPLKGLSKKDRDYLASVIPPKFKIEVDMDKDSIKLSEGYSSTRKRDTVSCRVDISKVNQEKCNRDFSATVLLFGEALTREAHVVIVKKKHSFNFKTNKKTSFESDLGSCVWYDYYSGRGGTKYSGYLVIIEDSNGNIVGTEANKNFFEKNAAKIRKFGKGDGFSNKFKKVDVNNSNGFYNF